MRLIIILGLLFIVCTSVDAQHYKYIDSAKVMGPKSYRHYIKTNPDARLVAIKQYIPAIALDIRYATTNNFTHHQMYKQAGAFARLPVVRALKQVEADLKAKGLGLKIFDAYRPYVVTEKFYEVTPDTNFVADPRKGSKHNRGCAIDLTIVDLKTGKELPMGTGFDSFSKKAAALYTNLPKNEIDNRSMLRYAMQAHGFRVIKTEWWHFDFFGWAQYPLLDIPFSEI